ncbi:MAG: trypsin-like peptidase domain-containing protein [Bacteroidota bacterium]|nr:trypsin-like peptidase domain-containing protein [Bacteroidota bacterium]
MAWNKQLSQLRDAMATLIPFHNDVLPILTDAGINWQVIPLSQNPTTLWYNILSYADNNGDLDSLIEVLLVRYPRNPHLISFKEHLDYDTGPELASLDWKEPVEKETLEKITGAKSTLLPINFLEVGLKKAKSVARVLVKRPNGTEAGTGFLLPNNLFLTNHHVIDDLATAAMTTIQFDFEQSITGMAAMPVEFQLDAANGFATSKDNDWTAVRMKGDANTGFGAIDLVPVTAAKNDFVNIIQHPGGQYKQIGMYHNLVTYADQKIIQYLTDTEPGSSGSPVFNSQWQLVALHHSGGMLWEPGAKQTQLRNEGININIVIDGLKASNL